MVGLERRWARTGRHGELAERMSLHWMTPAGRGSTENDRNGSNVASLQLVEGYLKVLNGVAPHPTPLRTLARRSKHETRNTKRIRNRKLEARNKSENRNENAPTELGRVAQTFSVLGGVFPRGN